MRKFDWKMVLVVAPLFLFFVFHPNRQTPPRSQKPTVPLLSRAELKQLTDGGRTRVVYGLGGQRIEVTEGAMKRFRHIASASEKYQSTLYMGGR